MAESGNKTFVLCDESLNRNGFRVLMSGYQSEPFASNPVMLLAHKDRNDPIGRWLSPRVEGSQLVAEADFDMEDPDAAVVAGKVAREYLKGASVSIIALEWSDDPALMLSGQRLPTLVKWAIEEASICGIPVNMGSLKLSMANGEVLRLTADTPDVAVKLEDYLKQVGIVKHATPHVPTDNMKKVTILLGLSEGATEDQIAAAIEQLKLSTKMPEAVAIALVDAGIKTGSITENLRPLMLKLAAESPNDVADLVSKGLSKVAEDAPAGKPEEAKQSIAAELVKLAATQGGAAAKADDRTGWSYDQWAKDDAEGLLKLATEQPEVFAKLK